MDPHMFKGFIAKILFCCFLMSGYGGYVYGHGLIENPPSREYFCGKITRPEHSESPTLPYEECRPILKKNGAYNNDIYQFMSVLSHSRGYQNNSNPPINVCGFDTETFKGGASPWDAAINWPTSPMSPGPNEFRWDISYGPHFSDTEHFLYWITKDDFVFNPNVAIQWNDLEADPFCVIPWNDKDENKNPDIKADRDNNKFIMTCNVPQKEGRHIIYSEWGRTPPTDERFHSCMDVVFSGEQVNKAYARIAPLPNNEYYGADVIDLDGSNSTGDTFKWTVDSTSPELYQLTNADQSRATLTFQNPNAEQMVKVDLQVSFEGASSNAEVKFKHMPEVQTMWIDLGPVTQEPQILNVGDELTIRAIQKDGKDVYFPSKPLVITEELTAGDVWPMALAQAVNAENGDVILGVINNEGEAPIPVNDATSNRIYSLNTGPITNAYLQVRAPGTETPPPESTSGCVITLQNGNSEWWAGIEVGTDMNQFTLDFSQTGLDLSSVKIDMGEFKGSVDGQLIHITAKPSWVNSKTKGYMGFNGSNVAALKNFVIPTCQA
ncbi:MAG: lytic polysaccharide monooxygenase [Parachlamydiaceae bacterium]|nr:lytic polysaccharide monooxygenase [Parachlamydiaceae bacterium]